MKKSDIAILPDYFGAYINELGDIELSDALNNFGPNLFQPDIEKLRKIGDKIYSPGKWTIKDILQHLIDGERIFTYRALTFARDDKTELPGFEEKDYAMVANTVKRSLDDLMSEFQNLRKSTIDLFNSFGDSAMKRSGICFKGNYQWRSAQLIINYSFLFQFIPIIRLGK